MRICHVLQTLDPEAGGPPAVVARLSAAQAALGHEVAVVYYDCPAKLESVEASIRGIPGIGLVRRYPVPSGGQTERLFATGARGEIMRAATGSDVLHLHGVWCLP